MQRCLVALRAPGHGSRGDPPIQIGRVRGRGEKGILLAVFMLQQGEDRSVADRLGAILKKAAD